MAILYEILNKANGKRYIGVTSTLLRTRWASHLYRLRNGKFTKEIQEDFNFYGENAFVVNILEEGDEDLMYEKEELYSVGCDYNIIVGGRSSKARSQASRIHTDRIKNDEEYRKSFSKKVSLALLGHKHSEETKEKISLAKKGKKMSEEFKKNRSIKHSGEGNPNTVYFLNLTTGIYYTSKEIEYYFDKCIGHIRKMFRENNPLLKDFVKCKG